MHRLPRGTSFPAAVVALLVLGGCATSGARDLDAEFDEMILGLCSSHATIAADPVEAERSFDGRSHAALHELARVLQEDDERVVAGSLLVAKQRVEAGFTFDPPPADQVDRLSALIDEARQGLEVTGRQPPRCPS